MAICDWYRRRYGVDLDPDSEAIVTIGSKEGIAHLCARDARPGRRRPRARPRPIRSISTAASSRARRCRACRAARGEEFFDALMSAVSRLLAAPKTADHELPAQSDHATVDLAFIERVVEFARENEILVVHDFAYAELCFDGYQRALDDAGAGRERGRASSSSRSRRATTCPAGASASRSAIAK